MEMSFQKKLENYWFYYKWHTLGGIFLITVIIYLTINYFSKVEPDINVLLKTNNPVSIEMLDKLETVFQQYCGDYNKDKNIVVSVEALCIPADLNSEFIMSNRIKLTADLVNRTSLIIGGDKEYLDSLNPDSFFADIPLVNNEGEKYILLNSLQFMTDNKITLDEDVYLALREIPDKKDNDLKRFNDNKEFLENVIKNNRVS